MDKFLEELKELLAKHNAVILRSGTSRGEFVAYLDDENKYVQFDEEIDSDGIRLGMYKILEEGQP